MTEKESTKASPSLTRDDISELVSELFREAKEVDDANDSYSCEVATAHGMTRALFAAMWDALPDDAFLKDWVPKMLLEETDEMGQRAVMKKLES